MPTYPRRIAAGQFPRVDGGRTMLGPVHISSLPEAVVRSLRTDPFIGTRPLPALPAEQAPAFLSFRGRYSVEKARRVLGFVPRDNFASSMAESVDSLPRP